MDGRIFEGVYANGKLNGKCKKVEINHTEEGICKDGFLVSGKILCPNRPNSNYCDDALGRHLRIMKALKKDIPEPNAIKVVLVDPKD